MNNLPALRKADILIVDDVPDNLRLLNQILSKDYKVRLAPNGTSGLAAARSSPPDLILLDIMMPEMNGFEVATRLKAEPKTAEIPIIFISALGDTESKIHGFAKGGVDYVTKPFQEQEVLARVKTHLHIRALFKLAQAEIAERKRVEEALRQSEERFLLLMNSTEDVVFTLDREQRHTAIFGQWMGKNNLGANDFLGKTARDLFGNAAACHEDANRQALAGEYVIYDWSIGTARGVQHFQTSLSALRDADGNITGIVGIGRNITDRKRAEQAEHQQRLLADALRDTAESLNSSLDLNDIFEKILDKVNQIVQCDAMSVAWLDGDQVRFIRLRGFDAEQTRAFSESTLPVSNFTTYQQVLNTHQPLLVTDTRVDPAWESYPIAAWVRSHLEAPIIIDNQVAGIINLYSATPGFYTQEQADILQTFANQAAVAVHNAQLYAETEHLTVIDPLTGLYNRRGLYSFGVREIERARRSPGSSISLFFLDVDHFKSFNDTYSYAVGDQVLCDVARLIRSQVREVDLVCRYGGEEFIVIIAELSTEGIIQTAERLRASIANARHSTAAGEVSITASIGVANFNASTMAAWSTEPDGELLLSNLIERAGSMLHKAKQNGRNRFEVEA